MKRFFLDTNIIVDFLACRQPFAIHAQRIFQSAEQGEIQVYLSSHSLATAYYLLQKHSEDRLLRKALLAIVQACHVEVIDAERRKDPMNLYCSFVLDFEQICVG